MNDKIPQALIDKQGLTRQHTINTVIKAIHELQDQGYVIKIKDLIEHTGLSRSTFGKAHVRETLERYEIVKKKAVVDINKESKVLLTKEGRLRATLKCKDERINRLVAENLELKQECELLRGKLFLLSQMKM